MKKILITGGSGYIGSHTSLLFLESGFEVVVLDNLSNSSQESIKKVSEITGKKISIFIREIYATKMIYQRFLKGMILIL